MPPTSDEQIQFMVNIQRLLDEGLFTASYKFALLIALADLSVELGDDSGAPLELTTKAIAEKFILYYWRQTLPYAGPAEATILRQNTDRQAAIVNLVHDARADYGGSLATALRDQEGWRRLLSRVARVVREMPLWKLQRVGKEELKFLYEHQGHSRAIRLQPGVAYCLRKFYALISDLVRGAWIRYVRQQNLNVLGQTADLNEFLFGSERNNLAQVRPVLLDIQCGRCFYCNRAVAGATAHVDHFVPWARYPVDLGHNFVLADGGCNNKKRDRLPACDHLAAWTERNARYGTQIADALEERGIIAELAASNRIAEWAYAQTEAARGLTWLRADVMVPLAAEWKKLLP
jgi:5-methylcytosine-specific restriction endonuclease McrA